MDRGLERRLDQWKWVAFAFPKHIMDVQIASLKQEVYSDFRGLKLFFTKAWAMLHLNI